MKAFFREIFITLIIAVAVCFAVQSSAQTFVVVMSSMEPSFHEGQRLIVNKILYKFREPKRGEVIIFEAPDTLGGDYIKRIIALPGDALEIKDGAVYINGSELDEPYIMSPPKYTVRELEVPDNRYFVLGDNRNNSNDSHNDWLVPRENIIGKAWISTWPPNNWGMVPTFSPYPGS